MPPIGLYSAIAILSVAFVVFLFIYTDRSVRRYGEEPMESFASMSGLSTADKALWRERLPELAAFILFQGFITTDAAEENIVSVFNATEGRRGFLDLWSYLLDAAGSEYYTNQLWTDFVDWESKFPYETKPMTYLELKQFAKTHRMFNDDNWSQTLAKTTTDTFSTLTYFYNLVVQMERMLNQAIPSNPLAIEATTKRMRYLVCALDNSTTFETFQMALIGLGFRPQYYLYTANGYYYDRMKALKDQYREPALSIRMQNLAFLYYQWEVILATSGTGEISRMTTVLNGLPANCAGLSVAPNQPPSAGSSGTSGNSGNSGSATGGATGTGSVFTGVYSRIPTPPFKKVVVPEILVPKITPAPPKDAVAFTPLDTSGDRTRFFWFSMVFFLIVFILWDILFYMLFSSGSSAAPAQTQVPMQAQAQAQQAPAPVARKESSYYDGVYDARQES
jgi:hypothetical protein